jgi:Zn-dependent protease with chaperone function
MLHNLIFIGLAVLLAFSFPLGIEPAFYDPVAAGLGAAAVVALSTLSGALASRIGARRRTTPRPDGQARAPVSLLANPPALARGFVLLWFSLLVYGLNWPWFVQYTLGFGGIVAVEKLFVLLPAVAGLMASLAGGSVAEPGRKRGGLTLLGHLAFQVRLFFGFALVPVFGIMIAFDTLESVPSVSDLLQVYQSLYFVASALVLLGAYALAPLILRAAFRTRSLEKWLQARSAASLSGDPPGEPAGIAPAGAGHGLMERLNSLRLRFGMPNVRFLVWETGGARVANAGMVGLLGGFRYVLLSDMLFEIMTPEELEAVVGHELGHARNKHLLIYFVCALAFMMLGQFVFGLLAAFNTPPIVQFLFSAVFVLSFWKAVLGGLSRVFECQADLEGARAAGSPVPFTSAMEKIAAAAQVDRNAPNWMYRSVAARIAFVWTAFNVPDEESRFLDTVRRIRRRIGQVALLALLGLVWMVVDDFTQAEKRRSELERISIAELHFRIGCGHIGHTEYAQQQFDRACSEFRLVVALVPHWTPGKILLADTLRELGRVREAWETWQSAEQDEPAHPIHRIGLREVKEALLAAGRGGF